MNPLLPSEFLMLSSPKLLNGLATLKLVKRGACLADFTTENSKGRKIKPEKMHPAFPLCPVDKSSLLSSFSFFFLL